MSYRAYIPLLLTMMALLGGCGSVDNIEPEAAVKETARPNFVLILVDDLGYSDIAPFGGEIPTPTLSRLAGEGTRYSNFHTAMKCNPTRAMLMTGRDNNLGAFGPRTNYQLRDDVPTVAERLRSAGYHTYIAGKWDLGSDPGERPFERGFERSMVLLPGAGTHFRVPAGGDLRDDGTTRGYSADGTDLALPGDFYSTKFYTDKMIEFIDRNSASGRPFFAYLSLTAPHYPLQAPAAAIDQFSGHYRQGYAAVARARVTKLRELGLINEAHQPWSELADWDALTEAEKIYEAKRMQVYAAMVSEIDRYVGQLLAFLDRRGLRDNTLVIFASDNGADGTARGAGYRDTYNNNVDNLGAASSYVTQGRSWAQVSSTPWRLVKGFPTEGGTRTPLIARWPGQIPAGEINHHWFRISDLAPTFLELAGIAPPDNESATLGRSARDLLLAGEAIYADDQERIHTYVERRLGGASVLHQNWKLVWWKQRRQYRTPLLFDLTRDPMETLDVAAEHPDVVADLIRRWQAYAQPLGQGVAEADPAPRKKN